MSAIFAVGYAITVYLSTTPHLTDRSLKQYISFVLLYDLLMLLTSVTRKKSPNVYKSCPKMISLEKMKDFDTFTKIA